MKPKNGSLPDHYQTMSLRLPRPIHERMKALASRRGSRAAETYIDTVEAFIRDHLSDDQHIFAVENDAVHITISTPGAFVRAGGEAAKGRRVSPNELIYTAVLRELDATAAQGVG